MNQFTVIEGKAAKRLGYRYLLERFPLAVIELKNPGDENATVGGIAIVFRPTHGAANTRGERKPEPECSYDSPRIGHAALYHCPYNFRESATQHCSCTLGR
jgi:hypothetical protein